MINDIDYSKSVQKNAHKLHSVVLEHRLQGKQPPKGHEEYSMKLYRPCTQADVHRMTIIRTVTVWYRRNGEWEYYYRVFRSDGTSFEDHSYRPEYFAPGVIQEAE